MNRVVLVRRPIPASSYVTTVAAAMAIVIGTDPTQANQSQTLTRLLLLTDVRAATTRTTCRLVCPMISSTMALTVLPKTAWRIYF